MKYLLFVVLFFLQFSVAFSANKDELILESNFGTFKWVKEDEFPRRNVLYKLDPKGAFTELEYPFSNFVFVKGESFKFFILNGNLTLDLNVQGISFRYKQNEGAWVCISDGIFEEYKSPKAEIIAEHVWLYKILEKREKNLLLKGERLTYERPVFYSVSIAQGDATARDIMQEIESLKHKIDREMNKDVVPNLADNMRVDKKAPFRGKDATSDRVEKEPCSWIWLIFAAGILFAGTTALIIFRSRQKRK